MPLSSLFQRLRQMAAPGQTRASEVAPVSPSDVEAARVRARRRLIGMVVLVGAGIVGFPWLFETQPRAMSQDVEMVHATLGGSDDSLTVARGASRNASGRVAVAGIVPPQEDRAEPARRSQDATGGTQREGREEPRQPSVARADEQRESMSSKPPERAATGDKPANKPMAVKEQPAKPTAKEAPKEAAKPAVAAKPEKAADKGNDKANDKAQDRKPADNGKAPDKAVADKDKPGASRYVVQFGAFADAGAARTARAKVEKLGIKTYAQQVDTPGGKRIRVRIGPYADKAEADKALAALKKAGLAGAVLTL